MKFVFVCAYGQDRSPTAAKLADEIAAENQDLKDALIPRIEEIFDNLDKLSNKSNKS